MPAVCVKGLKPGKLQQHSWVRTVEQDCTCSRKTRLNAVITHDLASHQGTDNVWTHKGCVHNEVAALVCRHQLDAPKCTMVKELDEQASILAAAVLEQAGIEALDPATRGDIVNHYSGGKKKLFQRAKESLDVEGIHVDDAKIRMFIKADKYHEPEVKAPRAIQYRSKRYALEWARFVHPIEKVLYATVDWTETRSCAKGRNLKERAQDLLTKADSFEDPLFLCLDHSKFDAHVTTELLKVESRFYQKFFKGSDRKKVRKLMRMQLINRGVTKSGTRYKTLGTRMSGDQNTALGNTALNIMILSVWLRGVKSSMYVDGDDSVVIIEKRDRSKLPDLKSTMAAMSMETKIEETDDFESVDFCQSRPVITAEGWKLVRNPIRVISRAGWCVYNMPRSLIERWVRSVGLCEQVTGRGVPILQTLGEKMAEAGAGAYLETDKHHEARLLQHTVERVRSLEITPEARASFERAWGITSDEQVAIERSLRVDICGQVELFGNEFPYDRW